MHLLGFVVMWHAPWSGKAISIYVVEHNSILKKNLAVLPVPKSLLLLSVYLPLRSRPKRERRNE
jgi:hypothetical protein